MLRALRTRQIEDRLAWGLGWVGGDSLFTEEDGRPTHPQTDHQPTPARAAEKAQVPWVGLHGSRHTMAVLALSSGVPLKVVSERLGHTSTSFTADLYQHVIPGMQLSASSAISRALGMSEPTQGSDGTPVHTQCMTRGPE